jgi:hypothetical protein
MRTLAGAPSSSAAPLTGGGRAVAGASPAAAGRVAEGLRYPLVAAACLVALIARSPGRLFHPSLWAEDNVVFLAQGRHDGVRAVLEPYNGYLHLLPRLVAAVAAALPTTWAPSVFAGAGYISLALFCASAASSRLAWLIPPVGARIALAVVLAVGPGRSETMGNTANIVFTETIALLLLGLMTDPMSARGRWAETCFIAATGLTGPLAIYLVPLFAARALRLRSSQSRRLIVVLGLTTAVQMCFVIRSGRLTEHEGGPLTIVSYGYRRLAALWTIGDEHLLAAWAAHSDLVGLAAATTVCAAALGWTALPTGSAIGLAVTVAVAIAAPATAYGQQIVGPLDASRHTTLPIAALQIVTIAALTRTGGSLHGRTRAISVRAAGAVLAATALGGIVADWRPPALEYVPVGPFAQCIRALDRGALPSGAAARAFSVHDGTGGCLLPGLPDPAAWVVRYTH